MAYDIVYLASEALHELGIPVHLKGYHYLREAIVLAVGQPAITNVMMTYLYPMVAQKYKTTPVRVERAMRHSILVGWNRGQCETWLNYFSDTHISKKPSNTQFISTISNRIRGKTT